MRWTRSPSAADEVYSSSTPPDSSTYRILPSDPIPQIRQPLLQRHRKQLHPRKERLRINRTREPHSTKILVARITPIQQRSYIRNMHHPIIHNSKDLVLRQRNTIRRNVVGGLLRLRQGSNLLRGEHCVRGIDVPRTVLIRLGDIRGLGAYGEVALQHDRKCSSEVNLLSIV